MDRSIELVYYTNIECFIKQKVLPTSLTVKTVVNSIGQ